MRPTTEAKAQLLKDGSSFHARTPQPSNLFVYETSIPQPMSEVPTEDRETINEAEFEGIMEVTRGSGMEAV